MAFTRMPRGPCRGARTTGVNTASGTGTGVTQTLNVYGRVAPQTTPKPGTYSDTVIATVTY